MQTGQSAGMSLSARRQLSLCYQAPTSPLTTALLCGQRLLSRCCITSADRVGDLAPCWISLSKEECWFQSATPPTHPMTVVPVLLTCRPCHRRQLARTPPLQHLIMSDASSCMTQAPVSPDWRASGMCAQQRQQEPQQPAQTAAALRGLGQSPAGCEVCMAVDTLHGQSSNPTTQQQDGVLPLGPSLSRPVPQAGQGSLSRTTSCGLLQRPCPAPYMGQIQAWPPPLEPSKGMRHSTGHRPLVGESPSLQPSLAVCSTPAAAGTTRMNARDPARAAPHSHCGGT